MARVVRLRGAMAIPVGHRVTVTYFDEVNRSSGLFGGEKIERRALETPRVEDLDTGIVYGQFKHHVGAGGISQTKLNITSLELRPELEIRDSFTGKISRCQLTEVSFDLGHQHTHTETWLELELE